MCNIDRIIDHRCSKKEFYRWGTQKKNYDPHCALELERKILEVDTMTDSEIFCLMQSYILQLNVLILLGKVSTVVTLILDTQMPETFQPRDLLCPDFRLKERLRTK